MRQRQLPIDLKNWYDLKTDVPGLKEAARNIPPKFVGVKMYPLTLDYEGTMHHLKKHRRRALTLQEGLFAFTDNLKFANKFKYRPQFYIEGKGTDMQGFYTIMTDGTIIKGRSEDPERNLYVWSGNYPLFLHINPSRDETVNKGRRFDLHADRRSKRHASMVLGLPQDMPLNEICK